LDAESHTKSPPVPSGLSTGKACRLNTMVPGHMPARVRLKDFTSKVTSQLSEIIRIFVY
jgi:hypothetical protein